MWFHLELKNRGYGAALSGVAVSDNAAGPFRFIRAERPDKGAWPVNVLPEHKTRKFNVNHARFDGGSASEPTDSINFLGRDYEGGQMARDMNLFADDDGKAYHIFSSEENSTIHISQLSDDYLSHIGHYVRVFVGRYMEGAALCKSEGVYYFVASGCTGWAPNAARSASAPSIFGPWTELGNPCEGEDSALTFHSQSTYILPVAGKKNAFIFMADRWAPENSIDGRYIWLPMGIESGRIVLRWKDNWDLNYFK
jgi:beta-xylosidase